MVRVNGSTPNAYWFDSPSKSLLDRRGPATKALIAQTLEPAQGYSYPYYYWVWPDTNSNTFMGLVAHQVPGLDLELPVTAAGKNFLGDNILIGDAPSCTGRKFRSFAWYAWYAWPSRPQRVSRLLFWALAWTSISHHWP